MSNQISNQEESQANMVYNSQRELLRMPEYGRNIQLMVEYVREIEDREERQAYAEKVVKLMQVMKPSNKALEDYVDKLWTHFFQIAEFEIDVDTPTGVTPTYENNKKIPEILGYPHEEMRFRHYGFYIQKMLKSAMAMEDEEKKAGYFRTIGSYMKLAYKTWNREHYVSDEIIKEDLMALTNGEVKLDEETSLDLLANPINKRRPSNTRRQNNNQKSGYNRGGRNQGRSGGNYRKNNNNKNRYR